jgi:hypothetical protein
MAMPSALICRSASADLLADQRRQAFGGFVQDQQLGVGHQRAADGQHLLLAARQLVAEVGRALGQARKQAVHALDGPGIGRPRRRPVATRFSRTLRLGNTCRPSGTRPRPSRAIA